MNINNFKIPNNLLDKIYYDLLLYYELVNIKII